METLKNSILPYLKTDFEKDLLEAAMTNLNDSGNKLRLNNFAYAARELTRHFLKRLAPDSEVLGAPWFKVENRAKPNEPTRSQRIKYAIQGYLNDKYLRDELNLDLMEVSKNLKKSIDDLCKYTHVNPGTFDVEEATIIDVSHNIIEDMLRFFMTVTDAKLQVMNAVYACINEEMASQFYIETNEELDILSSHYDVLGYLITTLSQQAKDDSTITMRADGVVRVRLQYGSDGDMRRGNGLETIVKFPFTSTFVANYKNQDGDVHIESASIEVDNNTFYE